MNDPDPPAAPPGPSGPAHGPIEGALDRLLSVFWNREERRVRALWRVGALIMVMVALGRAVQATGLLPEPGTRAFYLVGSVARTVLALVGVGLVGRLLDRRRLREYGLALDRAWVADFAFGLLLGAGLMSVVFLVEWGLGWLTVTGLCRTTVVGEPFARAILAPALLFVGVAIVEELLARGYLLRNLAEGLSFPRLGGARGGLAWACLVSSVLFALGHVGNPHATWVSTVNIAVAGVLLALGYMLTGQLGLPIGLHISWNFFQASVYGFAVSGVSRFRTTLIATEQTGPELWTGGVFGPEAGLLGLAAMFAGATATVLWAGRRRGGVRLATGLVEPPPRPARRARTPELVVGDA